MAAAGGVKVTQVGKFGGVPDREAPPSAMCMSSKRTPKSKLVNTELELH